MYCPGFFDRSSNTELYINIFPENTGKHFFDKRPLVLFQILSDKSIRDTYDEMLIPAFQSDSLAQPCTEICLIDLKL